VYLRVEQWVKFTKCVVLRESRRNFEEGMEMIGRDARNIDFVSYYRPLSVPFSLA
jgi:hypothetical protein